MPAIDGSKTTETTSLFTHIVVACDEKADIIPIKTNKNIFFISVFPFVFRFVFFGRRGGEYHFAKASWHRFAVRHPQNADAVLIFFQPLVNWELSEREMGGLETLYHIDSNIAERNVSSVATAVAHADVQLDAHVDALA